MFFLLLPPQPLFPKDRKYPSLNERSKTLDAPRKQKKEEEEEEEEKKEAVTLVARKKHETSCVLHLPSQTIATTVVVYIVEFITYLQ
jgi:hypothetical protein